MADDLTVDVTETNVETPGAASAVEAPATPAKRAPRKAAAKKAAPVAEGDAVATPEKPAKKAAAKRAAKKPAKAAEEPTPASAEATAEAASDDSPARPAAKKAAAKKAPAKRAAAKKTTVKKAAAKKTAAAAPELDEVASEPPVPTLDETAEVADVLTSAAPVLPAAPGVLFQAPEPTPAPRRRARKAAPAVEEAVVEATEVEATESEPAQDEEADAELEAAAAVDQPDSDDDPWAVYEAEGAEPAETVDADDSDEDEEDDEEDSAPARRRRRRGGRRRRKAGSAAGDEAVDAEDATAEEDEADAEAGADGEGPESGSSRRRRRRRRSGESGSAEDDAEPGVSTVVRVRESRPLEQQITSISGSTRLEAKKQRRRDGREAGRRRAPIVSEAEFLARRESVERVMVVRQREDLTQIGVVEDKVLVEHYVARESQTSLIGNIYLGRVQNVLPSMEAAFVDIGKGRNAVLYAGEVNWAALGHKDGQQRKIESVLSSGQTVLVQVTKDPVGQKGARLTSQISLAGRFLVYVPDGTTSGISRKLPDTERNRLKSVLKEIVPDTAGVIVRTAAEGASEDELTRDVERLKARWDDIEAKSRGNAPQLLYGEPDLTLKVVRDLFTEDFARLVVQGDDAWETVKSYVDHVAPDLAERLEKHEVDESTPDLFSVYRVDEQIAKGLDRKVWLPSGGSLVIDRTEAMTVVDVNTGKFTGSGGNLEETVTKNNLEAAEEIVRQLRLRDIGGIIVVDFIDMVLESNRDLVLRRMVECLGRDRTRHQVAEVTSLGLVQMTRKRIGTGLVEAFSETCSHCQGRGIVVHDHPVATSGAPQVEPDEPRNRRRRGGRGRAGGDEAVETGHKPVIPTPKDIAALPRHEHEEAATEVDGGAERAEPESPETGEVRAGAVVEVDGGAVSAEAAVAPVESETPARQEQPAAVPEAVAPQVVTRARGRRGASTAVISTGEAAVVEVSVEEAPAVVTAEAERPRVVTRTRRGASRNVVHTGED